MDSMIERAGKAVQLLVMIVFAICGPQYNVGDSTPSYGFFRGLTLALMVSRLVLALEYVQTAIFARHCKDNIIKLPLLLTAGTYFITAMVYLGVFFAFSPERNGTYIAWYVLAALETGFVIAISIIWRSVCFTNTHLVERMSLLTLIILGEGAISTARAVQLISTSDGVFSFTGSGAALVFCAVLNLYFMYMIYFDWLDEELFGTIRLQIWSCLHFPLHVALALAVEGAAQCITWNAGIQRTNQLVDQFRSLADEPFHTTPLPSAATFREGAIALNETATELLTRQLASSTEIWETFESLGYWHQKDVAALPAILNGRTEPDTARNAIWWFVGVLYNTAFKIAGFTGPVTDAEKQLSISYLDNGSIDFSLVNGTEYEEQAYDNFRKSWQVFLLTYVYFFVAVGCFVLICTILAVLNRGKLTKLVWWRLLLTSLIGTGIALLTIISGDGQPGAVCNERVDAADNYAGTVHLCLLRICIGRVTWQD